MDSEKTVRSRQQPLAGASRSSDDKVVKGYPAITRFAHTPVPSAGGGNGLPHQLQQDVEALSGVSMVDTLVHYNSSAPAQIGALAYAKGNQIHLGPGQEKHLPHEAWHVVQQKQGRVKPTLQAKGLAINDSLALETEADVMGQRTVQLKTTANLPSTSLSNPGLDTSNVVQRKIGFEFQAYDSIYVRNPPDEDPAELGYGAGFSVETDGGAAKNELEIVTDPVDETEAGLTQLRKIMDDIVDFVTQIENGKKLTLIEKPVKWHDIDEVEDSVFSIPNGKKHFHPQATVGVKFEKIAELIDYVTKAPFKNGGEPIGPEPEETKDPKAAQANIFGWSSKDDQQPFRDAWANGLRQAAGDIKDDNPREKGFAAMMYGFEKYKSSGAVPADRGSAKYFMPFLLRNGFLPFYKALNGPDKKRVKNQLLDNYSVMLDDIKAPGFGTDLITGTGTRMGAVMEFLADDEEHIHSLTESHGEINKKTYEGWKLNSVDDIGMSDTEEIGEKRRGAIIELRKLGNDVPAQKLKEFAEAVFTLIRLINAPNAVPTTTTPTGPMPVLPPPPRNELTSKTRKALLDLAKRQAEIPPASTPPLSS
jgi:hypothetical protein